MWNDLPIEQRQEYKKMILAFASLTEIFAQKSDNDQLSPIINSKYQETIFQKVFNATAEDIGNTSYDAAIELKHDNGKSTKYLIGIKTFGKYSGAQKIAQFKANHNNWSNLIDTITINANDKTKEEINLVNKELYRELAMQIATIRNLRIDSSIANIRGFQVNLDEDNVEPVYHVLMPSKSGEQPKIFVGETTYDKINIEKIHIIGCTDAKHPTNFEFNDGNHIYKYTSADSQLHMKFNNHDIVYDEWDVKYATNAYEIFAQLADKIYKEETPKVESYSWCITDSNGQVPLYSGFNSFFGVGSKLSSNIRSTVVEKLYKKYINVIPANTLKYITDNILKYLVTPAATSATKLRKVRDRKNIVTELKNIKNADFEKDVIKLLYRPQNEMYIPIPNALRFHKEHPNFFVNNIMSLNIAENSSLKFSKERNSKLLRKFTLVFEPSGKEIEAYITQDDGKAIESYEKQSYLGEWILRKIFQLDTYEPLTVQRLNELGINGLRLAKDLKTGKIHLYFIWIDTNNPPKDFIS